jgi:hypothetical protein
MKTALYIVGGLAIILAIACAGCGSVELATDVDGGAAGSAGGPVEMTKLEGGTAGAGGVGGAAVTSGRSLGAGCVSDVECGSNICDNASRTCCDGRSDTCNTCVGGYKTPVKNGSVTCGVCEGGVLMPSQDGTPCGTSTCGGEIQPAGTGPLPTAGIPCQGIGGEKSYSTSCYYPTAINSACRAGVCVEVSTDCTVIACPAGCTKKYSACYATSTRGAVCYCVDSNYQSCISP